MMVLTYQIEVDATAEKVWRVLTEIELYSQWAKVFSPNSQFEGQWREGESVVFFDPEMGGTRAIIDKITPNQLIEYHHVSTFTPEHIQDIDSDVARKWIGSRESYSLQPMENSVIVQVTIETHPDFVSMFNQGWEKALPLIKLICEKQTP